MPKVTQLVSCGTRVKWVSLAPEPMENNYGCPLMMELQLGQTGMCEARLVRQISPCLPAPIPTTTQGPPTEPVFSSQVQPEREARSP